MLSVWLITWSALAADVPVGSAQAQQTLEEGLNEAQSGDRLLVDAGTYEADALTVDFDLIIEPAGLGTVTIELSGSNEAFLVETGGQLTLRGLVVDGMGAGPLIDVNDGTLNVEDSVLRGGVSSNDGGAIKARMDSVITVVDSEFTGNTANKGSAINVDRGTLDLRSSTFIGNDTNTGTVRCRKTTSCILVDNVFDANIANTAGVLAADDSAITHMSGTTACGGSNGADWVDLKKTTATIERSVFFDHSLTGALIYVSNNSDANIVNNHFVANVSTTPGAVLEVAGTAEFTNNLVTANTAVGAVLSIASGTVNANYNLFFSNTSSDADTALDATNVTGQDPLLGAWQLGNCDTSTLVPASGSPVIDAGDPAILDSDGTVADIGAFGNLSTGVIPPDDPDDVDGDGHLSDADCDDNDASVWEIVSVYRDQDRDGYGVGPLSDECALPNNGALVDGDCNDNDATVYPGAPEIPYDGIDQDCADGDLDDLDGDGHPYPEDCNDRNKHRGPSAFDVPHDGIDQNCNGWDGSSAFTGGAGLSCSGCTSTSANGGLAGWVLALLLLARRQPR